jgi:hypothetical protein
MYILCIDMSKQLKGQKEQGKIIAQMNGSTNYTVSCQSSRWKLERDDIKTLFDNKLIARMNRVNEVQKINMGVKRESLQ